MMIVSNKAMSWYELYLAYLHACAEYNSATGRDPAHDEMEWNHRLPKAIFGEWAIGEWLLKRQHAIATALQTLAFKQCVLCGWHIEYLPEWLWEECRPIYQQRSQTNGRKKKPGNGRATYEAGVGIFSEQSMRKARETLREMHMAGQGMCDKSRECYYDDKKRAGAIGGAIRAQQMRETNTGFYGQTKEEKAEAGRKGGQVARDKRLGVCGQTFEERSCNGKKGSQTTNAQRWISLYDGFISNAGGVATHNRNRGVASDYRLLLPGWMIEELLEMHTEVRVDRLHATGFMH